jgi:hypothetical protein
MLQLIYALKKHNNRRLPTPAPPRISFERTIHVLEEEGRDREGEEWEIRIKMLFLCHFFWQLLLL